MLLPTTLITDWATIGYCKTSDLCLMVKIFCKFSTIMYYYEIPTFLIDEHKDNQ